MKSRGDNVRMLRALLIVQGFRRTNSKNTMQFFNYERTVDFAVCIN